MISDFTFSVTPEEKRYLLELVRWSIARYLAGEGKVPPETLAAPATPLLQKELGAFVTLKLRGSLRGCIGHVVGEGPLYVTVAQMAQAAAFEDPRFGPVSIDEFDDLEIEISVLGPITACGDPSLVEIGRHGLIVRKGMQSGLLLPQVPVEWGWDRDTYLDQTCRKAGLPAGAWRDPATQLLWFEAVVFS